MFKTLRNVAPFAFAGVVVLLVGVGVWYIETPVHDDGEFYKHPMPAIGTSYAVKIAYLGVPDRDDLASVVPPFPYMEPERVERMVERGKAIWLQPGDQITLLRIRPETETDTETEQARINHALVETPHGELWVLLANVTASEKCELLSSD